VAVKYPAPQLHILEVAVSKRSLETFPSPTVVENFLILKCLINIIIYTVGMFHAVIGHEGP